jgi:CheY-like chemotaxis protein
MGSLKGPVIILEDDLEEREMLEEVLKKMNVKNPLKFFTSGDEFLQYLQATKDKPFLILSDVNLPRMNGLEVKRLINENEFLRKKSIPFVFISTTASRYAVEEAYNLTVQGFFVKQHSIKQMESHLRLIFEYWRECRHTNSD